MLVKERIRVDVVGGTNIDEAIQEAKELSAVRGEIVEFEFNSIIIRVDGETKIPQLVHEYWSSTRVSGVREPIGPSPEMILVL